MDIQGLMAHMGEIIESAKAVVPAVLLVLAAIGGVIKAIESVLQIIAPFTPWQWDNNLATALGKWAALKIFNKK